MGNRLSETAHELLEEKIPADLLSALKAAPYVWVKFAGKGFEGSISGVVDIDPVGLGWIYIDVSGSGKRGENASIKVTYTKNIKWKVNSDKSVLITVK